MNRVEQMQLIQKQALELFTKKNYDYGDAFAKYGIIGVLIRIQDKLQRYMQITKNGISLVNDEIKKSFKPGTFLKPVIFFL